MSHEPSAILKENLEGILQRIEGACKRSGRDPSEVTLVAVTKSVEIEVAGLLLDAGVEHLGENRVQEMERKHGALGDRGTWHMIGHLQRNKVKKALPLFSMIHSVDSERLLRELSGHCEKRGLSREILLEVNVSGEKSKYGLSPADLEPIVKLAMDLEGIELRGLMTMAPYSDDPEEARPFFQGLRELRDEVQEAGWAGPKFNVLSMGMTGDFEAAVEEGATHLRIGTALFEGL
ncbi:MAG: YggS family pyridoxal phosphate-dependent enzyme [Planctomycetota bacterium]|jgi:pyridoxal phosphate enzyme (YggS family)